MAKVVSRSSQSPRRLLSNIPPPSNGRAQCCLNPKQYLDPERHMAVCYAPMDSIVILDDEEDEERPQLSSSSSSAPAPFRASANHVTPPKVQLPAPTHITKSPFATAKKESHVLQAENQRLFTEFVEHCSAHTQDCPEVMTFLHAKHAKVSPDFLGSVEFRNTLGRCLTRAQASRAKTFVYINELCTVLRQHAAKRRQALATASPSASASSSFSAATTSSSSAKKKKEEEVKKKMKKEEVKEKEEEPSTSGQQEEEEREEGDVKEDEEKERKTKKASRRQIAYLENLLKVYSDEIRRLQEKELSIDDLMAEDSGYIQEHKLKRKMMKIYEKLCELKSCSSLTGRVIEQRVTYTGTRHPEINRKIERFINSREAQLNPPDYSDILRQVQLANGRHTLSLSKKQMVQIAQDAFRDAGNRLQERRHLDMVYNFGSHLTDVYKPGTDPALLDPALAKRLRSNREVALSSLEQVISKYAVQQDDQEEEDRRKRLEKKEAQKSEAEGVGGASEEKKKKEEEEEEEGEGPAEGEEPPEEEEDEDDDMSSDPDIEQEIQASEEQVGPGQDDGDDDDEEVEDDDGNNEAEPVNEEEKDQDGVSEPSAQDEGNSEEDKQPVSNGLSSVSGGDTPGLSPLTDEPSPLADEPSPTDSPSQSEPIGVDKGNDSANHNQEDAVSSNHVLAVSVSTSMDALDSSPHHAANQVSLPPSPVELLTNQDTSQLICETRSANCSPRPPSPRATRSRKRKREGEMVHVYPSESEVDIPLDMGVASSPLQADSTRADTPQQEVVTSSQYTPPPKKNKVNVATQCDPDEIIVLSDCE